MPANFALLIFGIKAKLNADTIARAINFALLIFGIKAKQPTSESFLPRLFCSTYIWNQGKIGPDIEFCADILFLHQKSNNFIDYYEVFAS